MNSKRVGCLVSSTVLAVLSAGAIWILSSSGDRHGVNEDLILAAREGNAAELKLLLDRGADPNAREILTPDATPGSIVDRISRIFRSTESIGEPGDSALTAAVQRMGL